MLVYLTRLCEYKQRLACGVSLPSQVSLRRHLLCLYMRGTYYTYHRVYIILCIYLSVCVCVLIYEFRQFSKIPETQALPLLYGSQ